MKDATRMDVGEFIDTYSDDLITIHEARAAAYTHPLRNDYVFAESLLDASFCRILLVFVVGGIEAMLESWRDRDRFNVLENYFAKKVTNSERVTSLYQAFLNAGIQVDRQIFDDFLAIKYLRNTVIHAQWKQHEKDWLDARGFPSDSRELRKEHLDRIEHVSQNMMLYISLAGMADSNAPRPAKLVRLDETITRRKDDSGIIRVGDIARIIWNNLERIDAHIYRDIEKAVVSKEYDWSAGRSQSELEALGADECKRLFYLAARCACGEGYEHLIRHRDLAKEALEFWREYWQRGIAQHEESFRPALDVFASPHFKPEMPEWSVIANVPGDVGYRLVDHILPSGGTLTSEQVVRAFDAGKRAYELVRNIMPVTLLVVRLPIVDPQNTLAYLREAERALEVFRLSRAWYECVEHHRRFTDESLGFYIRMCSEFSQRPLGE